jgi:GNAT superfamily N-acetyltransferase
MILRRATADDADAVADIDIAARRDAMPTVRWAHPSEDVRRWIRAVLLPTHEVWVAEEDGAVIAYMALHDDWIAQLYVRPGLWRRGIGTALLRHAQELHPDGLQLWCFQVNARARAFYESHDFTAVKFTDGAGNEEQEPDILYAWRCS